MKKNGEKASESCLYSVGKRQPRRFFVPTLSGYHQLKDNIAYHVINRGNRRLEIFHDEEDYN